MTQAYKIPLPSLKQLFNRYVKYFRQEYARVLLRDNLGLKTIGYLLHRILFIFKHPVFLDKTKIMICLVPAK